MFDAKRHKFDVVLVWAFDRMARSVRHFLEILDELNRLKIEFIVDTGSILALFGPSKEEADQRLTEVLVALPGIEPGFED